MQPAAPRNTTASQQCTQFWVLPALVLLVLCTPLASAAREWAAQTWSEHLPRICTAVLLYHAARNWASSLARRIPTLASTQAARHGPSPTSVVQPPAAEFAGVCEQPPAASLQVGGPHVVGFVGVCAQQPVASLQVATPHVAGHMGFG